MLLLSRLKFIFLYFLRLPTAMAWNLSVLAFMWLAANHLISIKLSSARFANSFENTQSAADCIVVQFTVFKNMENIVDKYVEENRTKNGSLRHILEDRLKIIFESTEFDTLLSIS